MGCNINKYSSVLLLKDKQNKRGNRGKLDTGTFCNYDCEFCYYQGMLDIKTNFDEIKKRIDDLYRYGITEVDLSGGESSIHKNWFEILDYCNTRFSNISTLTNGWAFSSEAFLKKSIQHGLKEILFSVHGYDEQSHDEIVRRKGAWKRLMKAISLAKKHNLVIRINCTVYQNNSDGLKQYHHVINQIKPLELNFLTLNYWTNNRHAQPINYKDVTDNIKKCIDLVKDNVKHINVRYTPYCYMKGYEKYVCNQFQHIYDIYDWNLEMYGHHHVDTTTKYTEDEKIDMAFQVARKRREEDYKKNKECLKCKHYYICDGVENEVVNFSPVAEPGKKITEVNYYRNNFYE